MKKKAAKKPEDFVVLDLRLPNAVATALSELSGLAGVTPEQAIRVLLALGLKEWNRRGKERA